MIAILFTVMLVAIFTIGFLFGQASGLNEARDILRDLTEKDKTNETK